MFAEEVAEKKTEKRWAYTTGTGYGTNYGSAYNTGYGYNNGYNQLYNPLGKYANRYDLISIAKNKNKKTLNTCALHVWWITCWIKSKAWKFRKLALSFSHKLFNDALCWYAHNVSLMGFLILRADMSKTIVNCLPSIEP